MFELKPISVAAIPAALEKVKRYRLLGEPHEAESICRDILTVEPDNQDALIGLILALTDQFGKGPSTGVNATKKLLPGLKSEYHQKYYEGIIYERQAKACLGHSSPDNKYDTYEWLQNAMNLYEEAEKIRPSGDDSTILRWNTCARLIMARKLEPRPDDDYEPYLE